ncbi:MAG: repressor LexA [Anaerolineales bacterium]|nr:repressor LexA [Anaerolineales bacterium]
MARKKSLSRRQKDILDFIQDFLNDNGFPPTIREIGKAVSITSTSVVNYNLNRLQEMGYLSREREVSRGLRLKDSLLRTALKIPLAGRIMAGEPVEIDVRAFGEEDAIELSRDLLPAHDQNQQLYALEVRGDSMIDAMVDEGDIVIMSPQHEARDGDMVAAWLSDRDETTLKYFYNEGDRVRLQPANPTMDPIYVDPAIVQIQGKVLMVVRQLA